MKKRWQGEGGYREVLKVAIPLVLSMGSWGFKHFVDRVFLSWYGDDALAAALPASILSFSIGAFFLGTIGYINTFVAQYSGANRPARVGASVWQGVYFGLATGAVMLLLIPAAPKIFSYAGHERQVVELEVIYFQILCTGWIPLLPMQALSAFFTGRSDTRTVMWVSMASAAANIVLDYAWIFGNLGFPEGGIAGAGWATVASQTLELILYAVLISRLRFRREFHTWSAWRYDGELMRRILRYGTPNGFQHFLEVFGFAIFVMIVGRLGTVVLAATNVTININTLAFLPMIGLGIAVSTLVGRYLGMDNPDLAARVTWSSIHISCLYMLVMSILFVFLPGVFTKPFESGADPESFPAIKEMTFTFLKFVAVYCVFDAFYIVFSAAVKGAGDTKFVMWTTFIASLTIMILPVYIGVNMLGQGAIFAWLCSSTFIILMSLVFYFRFRGGKWKTMRVIEGAEPPGVEVWSKQDIRAV